jgi:hypothetical protein
MRRSVALSEESRLMNTMNILAVIKRWIDVSDPRSWLAHSVVGVAIALVSHALGFNTLASAWAVFTLFFVRELEQAGLAFVYHEQPHWFDALMDFLTPTLAALVTGLLLA